MKIGYQEQLFMIIVGIFLLITGVWALGSKKGLYVFGSIAGIVFVLVALQYLNRGKAIVLKLHPDEKVLLEEIGVKATLKYANKSEIAPECKVTLTNLRVIVGKRILFSPEYRESYHFYFTERNKQIPSPINFTAVVASLSINSVSVKSRKDKPFIHLKTASNLASMQYAELYIEGVEKFIEELK
ncbi:hypothetical protein [Microscilla marina]|uniref:Uncharacterized protein n=1 Tax=Microscilla marina ATCC 23134 TaxID=313606 RepID=A1ZK50_MICM2|nr:hypothetical protein [Microscilla marina]EAY29076.1 hypothetical protein M23134_02267 [Microscilla marina ATCC 23134]